MRFQRNHITGVALLLIISLISETTQRGGLFGLGRSHSSHPYPPRPLPAPVHRAPARSRGSMLLPVAAGYALGFGATYLAMQAIKKNNPCAFRNAGITETGEMNSRIKANERCRQAYAKYQNDLAKCPNVTEVACTEIGGDTKCAVILADGVAIPIYDCA